MNVMLVTYFFSLTNCTCRCCRFCLSYRNKLICGSPFRPPFPSVISYRPQLRPSSYCLIASLIVPPLCHSSGNRESNPTLWLECQRSADELFPQYGQPAQNFHCPSLYFGRYFLSLRLKWDSNPRITVLRTVALITSPFNQTNAVKPPLAWQI